LPGVRHNLVTGIAGACVLEMAVNGDPDISMALFRRLGDGAHEQRRAEIKLDSFKLKKICKCCNNGWMSKLEESAKPLILGLIRGLRELNSLSEDERRILARWAGKTAIVESHSVGAECPLPGEYLKRMRTNVGGIPGRFAVVACHTEMQGFGHMQIGVIRDLIGGAKVSGNIIMIALPKLVFACAFPMLEIPYECRRVKSLYTPLWPPPAAWYPMDQAAMPSGLDDLESLAAMAERVELFHSVK
jgi:hypothetical protein